MVYGVSLNLRTNRKLKVSIVVSDLSKSGAFRWGGAVRPFLLAQALKRLDYQVEILGVAFNNEIADFSSTEFPIIAFPCHYYSGFLTAAKQLIQRIDGDLVYAVKLKPSSFGVALIKKFYNRRPLVLDIDDWELSWHGGEQFKYKPSLKQLARDMFQTDGALKYPDHPLYLQKLESLTKYADIITTHNRFLQQRFGGIYIPNGKDTELFDPAKYNPEKSRIKYGLDGYKILMFPGAPRPYKGLEDVLEALDLLDRSDLKLAIVGGSPYDDYDQQLMSKWSKWIVQLPKYSVETMPEIVSAAHIVVVPQRDNPASVAQFPLKLTDAMAMAKPILSTRVGDIPDILGDTGYLVDPNSTVQIAQTIQLILANLEAANNLAIKARERCIQKYSIAEMSHNLKLILNDLV